MGRFWKTWVLLLALAVGGLGSTAWAQFGPGFDSGQKWFQSFRDPTTNAWRQTFGANATREAVRQFDSGSGSTRRAVRFGKTFVRRASVVVGGFLLINDALNWFYEEAQKAANPGLDVWYETQKGGGGEVAPPSGGQWPAPGAGRVRWAEWIVDSGEKVYFDVSYGGMTNGVEEFFTYRTNPVGSPPNCSRSSGEAFTSPRNKETVLEQYGDWLRSWSDHACLEGGGEGPARSLEEVIDESPENLRALEEDIIGGYLQQKARGPHGDGNPYMWSDPFGDGYVTIEFEPGDGNMNGNVWRDNPFWNPGLDTDGDGFEDAKEAIAGTDPDDAGSTPAVDPFEPPDEDDPALRDSDGDGIPDAHDPCPYDEWNECAAAEQFGDCGELACEETLQAAANSLANLEDLSSEELAAVQTAIETLELMHGIGEEQRDLLQDIYDHLTEEEEDEEDEEEEGLEAWKPGEISTEAWEAIATRLTDRLNSVKEAASSKAVFSMSGIIPVLTAPGGSGTCQEIDITLLGQTRDLGWCNSQLYDLVTTWGRSGIALLMLVGFYFAVARTIAWTS